MKLGGRRRFRLEIREANISEGNKAKVLGWYGVFLIEHHERRWLFNGTKQQLTKVLGSALVTVRKMKR
jgi:hypothetical protein